jgi:hypothetical protein
MGRRKVRAASIPWAVQAELTGTRTERQAYILGALRGGEGWIALQSAVAERAQAKNAAAGFPGSLDRQANA